MGRSDAMQSSTQHRIHLGSRLNGHATLAEVLSPRIADQELPRTPRRPSQRLVHRAAVVTEVTAVRRIEFNRPGIQKGLPGGVGDRQRIPGDHGSGSNRRDIRGVKEEPVRPLHGHCNSERHADAGNRSKPRPMRAEAWTGFRSGIQCFAVKLLRADVQHGGTSTEGVRTIECRRRRRPTSNSRNYIDGTRSVRQKRRACGRFPLPDRSPAVQINNRWSPSATPCGSCYHRGTIPGTTAFSTCSCAARRGRALRTHRHGPSV